MGEGFGKSLTLNGLVTAQADNHMGSTAPRSQIKLMVHRFHLYPHFSALLHPNVSQTRPGSLHVPSNNTSLTMMVPSALLLQKFSHTKARNCF